jgi:hypothetical protein
MKKIIVFLLLLTLAATSAFAVNFSLGASGALYMTSEEFDKSDGGDIWDQFENGENVYYGVNAELLFDKVGLGLYTYFSFYEWYDPILIEQGYEMMDVDINLSLSYHFFGATAFLDPFVEAGFGSITRNVTAYDDGLGSGMVELDEPFPFLGTEYWFAGFGLGVNLGGLGGFAKVQYHHPTGNVEVETKDGDNNYTYTTEDFPLNDLKVVLGLKIIF